MTDLTQKIADQQVAQNKQPSIRDLVQQQAPQIEAQLAGVLNSTAFVRTVLSEIQKTPALAQASPQSLLGAVMLAAQLKLEIGSALGHFYLTPRKDRGEQIVLPIVGYQGLIELAYRSGRVSKIETFLIREGDQFDFWADSTGGMQYTWRPGTVGEQDAPWTGVIASASPSAGGPPMWAYLPKAKVLGRRPTNWDRGPWKTHEEEMARKTAVRELAPYLPKSTEFAQAVQATRDVEERGARVEYRQEVNELIVIEQETEPTS